LIETTAVKFFKPEQLKVFKKLPDDQRNTKISETFTATAAEPPVPDSTAAWDSLQSGWRKALREKSFRGWPENPPGIRLDHQSTQSKGGVTVRSWEFNSQQGITLPLVLLHRKGLEPRELDLVVLNAVDEPGWVELEQLLAGGGLGLPGRPKAKGDPEAFTRTESMLKRFKWGMAYTAPRGIGPTAWFANERKRVQVRRRFMLLGQTLDGMRTWDVIRSTGALRMVDGMKDVPLWMQGHRVMAGVTLYASLFVPDVTRIDLHHLPHSHRDGPIFLNVLRYLDTPQAVAMAAERSQVRIYQDTKSGWNYPLDVARELEWDGKQIVVRVLKKQADRK